MEHLRKEGFVLSDNLTFQVLGGGLIELVGVIECLGEIRVEVDKLLEVVSGDGPDALVQTARYSYNGAWLAAATSCDTTTRTRIAAETVPTITRTTTFTATTSSPVIAPASWRSTVARVGPR